MTNYTTSVGVQQFSITIGSSSTTGTVTITAVGSGAFIIYGGINNTVDNVFTEIGAYLQLTNSTTITATRAASTGTVTVKGCIIDGDTTNLIKSVQQGTINIPSTSSSNTATISAVTDANTAVHFMGLDSSNTSWSANMHLCRLSLSGTTLTATSGGTQAAGKSTNVAYQIVEFQSTALTATAVQRISASTSSNVSSFTASLTSITTTNAFTLGGGTTYNALNTPNTVLLRGQITNGTTFTVNVNTAGSNTKVFNASVIEFNNGVLNSSSQRGTTTLTGVTSNTSTITSVNTSYSLLSWLYNTATSLSTVLSRDDGAAVLTNSTTVTVTKNTSTDNITGSWEVAEFPAFSGGSPILINNLGGWFGI